MSEAERTYCSAKPLPEWELH